MSKNSLMVLCACVLSLLFGACKLAQHTWSPSEIAISGNYNNRIGSSLTLPSFPTYFKDPLLVKLIDTALQRNADILTAIERVEMAKANMRSTRAAFYPTLDVNLSASGTRYGKYTIDGVGNAASTEIPGPVTPNYFAGVVSGWEADVWGKLRNRKKAARLRYMSSAAGKNFLATTIVAEVAIRYYALTALDEELKIITKNTKLQGDALEIVRLQKEAGRATELAVRQFEAQLSRTRAMEFHVRSEITATENELNFLIGRYPGEIFRGAMSDSVIEQVAGVGVPSQLLTRRQDIIQAEMELRATAADAASARAAFLPSFTIAGSAGYNAFNTSQLFDPASFAFSIAGGLVAPVFNRRQLQANYETALAGNRIAYHQYGKTVMNAVLEVCTLLEHLEGLSLQRKELENARFALDDAVNISSDLYLAGYANYLEVITAQRNALDAELDIVRTRKDILVSRVNLYRALGGS